MGLIVHTRAEFWSQQLGVRFTGLPGPWNNTVTIWWWQASGPPMPPSATLTLSLAKAVNSRFARAALDFTPLPLVDTSILL
jgi:hypothetical protein